MNLRVYSHLGLFKTIFFIAGSSLALGMFIYIQKIVMDLRQDSRQIQKLYANVYVKMVDLNTEEYNFLFSEFIQKSYFPVVQTEIDGTPTYWRGISVAEYDTSKVGREKVKQIVKILDKASPPIPLQYAGRTYGYLHFGDTKSIRALQILPYLQFIFIGIFILLGFMGYNNIRRSEQRFIWVGMAKETAHQLGTPISSLMGWVDLLQSRVNINPDIRDALDEIQNDVRRLHKIANRFSQIGSAPDLVQQDLSEIIHGVVDYFQKRLPQMKREVIITMQVNRLNPVPVNRELFEWVLENLIKNALEAIVNIPGQIEVVAQTDIHTKKIIVDVTDNGKGISHKNWNMVFRPGFSTKKRGWGLGLSLAKRIIDDYHKGNLFIKESKPGKGTTMRILLKM